MNQTDLSIAALLLGGSSLIQAADEMINPIVVTATRTAQSVDATLAPVSVITREEIEQSQAGNLTELLAGTIGIDVTETGWYGQSSGYFIRGASSKHILVLIDGVRLGSATTGSTDLVEIGLNHIERIEFVPTLVCEYSFVLYRDLSDKQVAEIACYLSILQPCNRKFPRILD
ncbi:MAG: TonB-dependent receptor plug domain-containing protein [Gammaproteobacteria bacterium]|nr:TonB-dependent receptor plug domain-containing protein [Gammaproteobacteria bacterium]